MEIPPSEVRAKYPDFRRIYQPPLGEAQVLALFGVQIQGFRGYPGPWQISSAAREWEFWDSKRGRSSVAKTLLSAIIIDGIHKPNTKKVQINTNGPERTL